MTENIPKSENLPDEIIPANETNAVNPKNETDFMEVHHHTHPPHGKKHGKIISGNF